MTVTAAAARGSRAAHTGDNSAAPASEVVADLELFDHDAFRALMRRKGKSYGDLLITLNARHGKGYDPQRTRWPEVDPALRNRAVAVLRGMPDRFPTVAV